MNMNAKSKTKTDILAQSKVFKSHLQQLYSPSSVPRVVKRTKL